MAWTVPTTRATGDLITASIWNTDIVENLKVLDAFAHTEFTSGVGCTATTEGTANTIVTAGAFTADGSTPVLIEFWCLRWSQTSGAGVQGDLWLYQDGSSIGKLWQGVPASGASHGAIKCERRMTPASGSRTYSVRGSTGSGTFTLDAGAGGAGAAMPGFIRVVGAP